MKNPVLILGAGTLGKVAADIFASNDVLVYGFLDDNKELHGKEIGEIVVLGETDDDGFLKIIGNKTEAFVAIDNNSERKKLVQMLNKRRHVMPVNAIHNTAVVSAEAVIEHGILIGARAVINPYSKVGSHSIIHAGAIIDAESHVGEFVQIGAGAIIGSGVEIEDEVFVGAGAVLISGVKIGKGARIGAGSVVIEHVDAKATVFGNPAKKV